MSITVSAGDVNRLRQITGAGMMDCKKALSEANGDFDAAIDWLRKTGQKVSEKRADREVNEGVVISLVSNDKKHGAVLSLACETDFVAKNENYVSFARSIAELALSKQPTTKEALLSLIMDGHTVAEKIAEQVGKIGEKIQVQDFGFIMGEHVAAYNHSNGKVGVLVALNKSGGDEIEQTAKDIAMQAAAMNPVAIDRGDVYEDIKARELEIGREQARAEGKPEAILEKIAMGKLEAYYKDATLLNQKFVKDNSKTIRDVLAGVDKELNVTAFKRVALGG